jgi:serine/threonine-protein kinase
VAYWLLTGQLVFSAESPMGLLVQHAQAEPVRPSARTELPIPPGLEAVVLSCLAKDPRDRPQTARELADRLGQLEDANAWTQERAREWWARHLPARAEVKLPVPSAALPVEPAGNKG